MDEVNAPPSTTVFKGDVWSFTVEPYAYPITGITATASSYDKTTTGPANTINGSGLTNDLHATGSDAMWISSMTGPTPVWIQYQFDKVYKLSELWVWNHNTEFEPVLGYGLKDVTIEYSTRRDDLDAAERRAVRPGAGRGRVRPQYDRGSRRRHGPVRRLTAKSNWSMVGLKQFGLSEVRFFYVPVEARAPQPAAARRGRRRGCRPGLAAGPRCDLAAGVFGTDKAAVADGTATGQDGDRAWLCPRRAGFRHDVLLEGR